MLQLDLGQLFAEHDEQSSEDLLLPNLLGGHFLLIVMKPNPSRCTWWTKNKKFRLTVLHNIPPGGSITLFPKISSRAKIGRDTAMPQNFTLQCKSWRRENFYYIDLGCFGNHLTLPDLRQHLPVLLRSPLSETNVVLGIGLKAGQVGVGLYCKDSFPFPVRSMLDTMSILVAGPCTDHTLGTQHHHSWA